MNPIYRRLVVVSAVGLVALLLLVLKNWVDTGYQEFQIELREVPAAASAPADDAKTYRVVLKDVAGLPKDLTTEADWKVLENELTRRLSARDGEKAIAMVEPPRWNSDKTVTLRPTKDVHFAELRSRLSGRPVSYANPARDLAHLNRGIDIRGGVEFICHLRNQQGEGVAATDEVMAILRSRLDERGLTEPTVTRMSNGDLQVVIPGGTKADAARTRKVLESSGRLEFREVLWPTADHSQMTIEGRPDMPGSQVIDLGNGRYGLAPGSKIYLGREDLLAPKEPELGEPPSTFYRLGPVRLTGLDVSDAGSTMHQGQLAVSIAFTAVGAGKNEEFTRALFNQDKERGGQGTGTLAILFDGVVKSAAHVTSPSSASCIIYGRFTQDEIDNLRSTLKGGSLAVTPEVLSERVVGATLGQEEIGRAVTTMLWSVAFIVLFLIFYYRRLGFVAIGAVVATGVLTWTAMSIFDATLTLPGIAGLLLSVAMSIDTNVLIYERIREELREDKGLLASIDAGYNRVFLTVIDSHLTTVAAGLVLYMLGSGPIQGFGMTLMIGVAISLFTGIYLGRLLTDWLCAGQQTLSMASVFKTLPLPYVGVRKISYALTLVTAVLGLGYFAFGHHLVGGTFQRNFDIDFTGGNLVQVTFREPIAPDALESGLRQAVDKLPAEQRQASVLNPDELQMQPYFSGFGLGQTASRQWVFRTRDEAGSLLELQRAAVEEERQAAERTLKQLRSGETPPALAEVKKQESQLAEKLGKIQELTAAIALRTESFKSDLAGAFAGKIHPEGEEITQASWQDGVLTMHLRTMEPPTASQTAEIERRLERSYKIKVSPAAADAGLVLTTAVTDGAAVAAGFDENDPYLRRLTSLLAGQAAIDRGNAPPTDLIKTRAAVALELFNKAADTAATVQVAVAKPFPTTQHFSGQVADRAKLQALVALAMAMMAMLAYIAARFEVAFGICAVISLLHVVLQSVGLIVLFGLRIDLTVIAGLLTVIGYAINDTIVVFDRIRENLVKKAGKPLAQIIDDSIAETMPRTILTGGCVITTLIAMLIFAGDSLQAFTATMLIGTLLGTYSSVLVAAPLLLTFQRRVIVPVVERPEDTGPDPSQGILAKPKNP